jgi:hypothetical protein
MNEKQQFAERLRKALVDAGYEPRPSVLEAHFNSRYWGRSVTYQAVRRWLIGLSIPEQEKLQVIADWLGLEAHVLRYGAGSAKPRIGEPRAVWDRQASPLDRKAIDQFLALPAERRKLAREWIAVLSESTDPRKPAGAKPKPRSRERPRRP